MKLRSGFEYSIASLELTRSYWAHQRRRRLVRYNQLRKCTLRKACVRAGRPIPSNHARLYNTIHDQSEAKPCSKACWTRASATLSLARRYSSGSFLESPDTKPGIRVVQVGSVSQEFDFELRHIRCQVKTEVTRWLGGILPYNSVSWHESEWDEVIPLKSKAKEHSSRCWCAMCKSTPYQFLIERDIFWSKYREVIRYGRENGYRVGGSWLAPRSILWAFEGYQREMREEMRGLTNRS